MSGTDVTRQNIYRFFRDFYPTPKPEEKHMKIDIKDIKF